MKSKIILFIPCVDSGGVEKNFFNFEFFNLKNSKLKKNFQPTRSTQGINSIIFTFRDSYIIIKFLKHFHIFYYLLNIYQFLFIINIIYFW